LITNSLEEVKVKTVKKYVVMLKLLDSFSYGFPQEQQLICDVLFVVNILANIARKMKLFRGS